MPRLLSLLLASLLLLFPCMQCILILFYVIVSVSQLWHVLRLHASLIWCLMILSLAYRSSSPVVVSVSLPVCVPPVCVFLLSQILLGPRRSLCIDPCSCFWVLLQILPCLLHVASLNYCRWPPVLPPVRERFHRSPYLCFWLTMFSWLVSPQPRFNSLDLYVQVFI